MSRLRERLSRIVRATKLPAVLILLALLAAIAWMAATIGNPFPPRTIMMATGPKGSAFDEFGVRYRELLARDGVDVKLVQTAGGGENLARLRDPHAGISVAMVENGLTNPAESPDVVSLGAIALEPLWLFSRRESRSDEVRLLRGKRLSIEPEGSGGRVMFRKLLSLNGIDETSLTLLGLTPEQGADALLRGEIDSAVMLTSWQSPVLRMLLVAEGVVLEGHPRADAYVALFPNLVKVVLPTGIADFAKNIPPADVPLLAIEASLVVRKDIHPGLQYLLLEAAGEIHGGPDVFHRAGRFPAAEAIDVPLSDQARAFYRADRPFVYRYLPFWIAGLAERLLIVLIPLFTVVLPLVQFAPRLYAHVIQGRIFRLYAELKFLEARLDRGGAGDSIDDLDNELNRLTKRANSLRVPLGYAQRLYILKSHIAAAGEEVERRRRLSSSGRDSSRQATAETDQATEVSS